MTQRPRRRDPADQQAAERAAAEQAAAEQALADASEPDFASEHTNVTFGDQLEGGPEAAGEPESPEGYAGLEPDRDED